MNGPSFDFFIDRIEFAPSGCWEWMGARTAAGYGYYTYSENGKHRCVSAHRLVFASENMLWPSSKLHVAHRCDNPACCNPDHLFLTTPWGNLKDKLDKGRHRTRASWLSPDEVVEIRRLYKTGEFTQKELAARFKLSTRHTRAVINREVWAGI